VETLGYGRKRRAKVIQLKFRNKKKEGTHTKKKRLRTGRAKNPTILLLGNTRAASRDAQRETLHSIISEYY